MKSFLLGVKNLCRMGAGTCPLWQQGGFGTGLAAIFRNGRHE
jgi:hypothetical protein